MKFTINSAELLSAISMLNRAQSNKNALPILDCIRMTLSADGLRLTAADSEQTLDTTITVLEPSDIDQSLCLPAQQFLSALKELPNQPITFMGDDRTGACKLEYANGCFNFVAQPADTFPMPVQEAYTNTLTLPARVFSQGLANTKNSISADELRPQMCGVALDVKEDGSVVFVASDGHSLSRYTVRNVHQLTTPFLFILPAKTTALLSALLNKQTDDVQLQVNDTNLRIEVGGFTLYARLVEGRYPNYNSVIPTDNPFSANVERDLLISAVRRVLVFASASTALVKFAFQDNALIVSAQDLDFNTSAEESVPCDYAQQPVAIGFSGTMLIDLLRTLPSTTLTVKLSDPSRAGVIVPTEQPDDEEMLLLLMPMMLKQ